MPVFEFKGDLGWGYNPAYFFTVEKSYGEPDDLRELIDQAHARGIGVILDLVLAHTAHRHPFNKLYPYDQSPWYGAGCGEQNQFGFPTLDYQKGPTEDFSRDVQRYWLHEFHADGFRYDYCHGIGCCGELGMPFLITRRGRSSQTRT
jgi:1,4-alpha-glucan branching enzyme